ncbi:MAG: hypothetical protein ACOYT8_02760 [Candidatus Dependentiae bacterium]
MSNDLTNPFRIIIYLLGVTFFIAAESIKLPVKNGFTIHIQNNSVQTINSSDQCTKPMEKVPVVNWVTNHPTKSLLASIIALYTVGGMLFFLLKYGARYIDCWSSWKSEVPLTILKQIKINDLMDELFIDVAKKYKEQEKWKLLYKTLSDIQRSIALYAAAFKIHGYFEYIKLDFLWNPISKKQTILEKIERLELLQDRISQFLTEKYHAQIS